MDAHHVDIVQRRSGHAGAEGIRRGDVHFRAGAGAVGADDRRLIRRSAADLPIAERLVPDVAFLEQQLIANAVAHQRTAMGDGGDRRVDGQAAVAVIALRAGDVNRLCASAGCDDREAVLVIGD